MAEAQLPPDDDVRAVLFRSDEGFRELVSRHHDLDEQLQRLSTLAYLTDQQQIEETALKKQKLALKDRIEAMVRGYHHGSPHMISH
jgi:uncharacterized protein YdcH (DUF465 family)